MWKIGPECAAQQAKWVSASATKAKVRKACAAVIDGMASAARSGCSGMPGAGIAGGGLRISIATGTSSATATMPTVSMAVRQSYAVISQRTKGAMISDCIPMPAETSDTARLRCRSNQAEAIVISGA